MKSWKLSLAEVRLIFFLLYLSSGAEARVSFGLSIGTSFGHRYPGYCYDYYPYPSYYSGYYSWWDAGWYRYYPRHRYWPRHSHSSLGVWIGGYYPMVIDPPVVRRKEAKGPGEASERAKEAAVQTQLNKAMQAKKDEQIKILKVGDKEKRIQAIHELAPLSLDNRVRHALEVVLLSDPDPELRKEVAVSLGKMENLLVLGALTQAKENDPIRDVRQAAYRSIIMIKGY